MDFQFTAEQEGLRKEIDGFLDEEIRQGSFEPHCDAWMHGFSAEFSRKVGERGWIGLTWPKKYGGQERSYMDRLVYAEEMLRYSAPVAAHWVGERQVGATIIHYGTEEQKEYYIPKIRKGGISFGLCFSEPNAGSDLGSVESRAIEKEDCFVLDGQKIWTTNAHLCDHGWLLARTDLDLPKHRGLSEFVLDFSLPGITIRPLVDITGTHRGLNEVFFDGVRLPKNALVGEKNNGWRQIMGQLDYERSGLERALANRPVFLDLIAYVKETTRDGQPLCKDVLTRNMLAELHTEYEVGRLLTYRVAWVLDQGGVPTAEAGMAKIICTGFEQHLTTVGMQILGHYGLLTGDSKWAAKKGNMAEEYLYSRVYTLQGGTSEIMKNLIAQRGLGLPAR